MDYVCIDNKYYDPYFILEVDQDDDLDHIIKCYKYKAKKYHPDKASNSKEKIKYEKRFKILTKCIEFIKDKRESSFINPDKIKKQYASSKKEISKDFTNNKDLTNFNDSFVEKSYSKSKFFLNSKKHSKNSNDLDNSIDTINQFKSTKFANDKFNLIFEYNQLKNTNKNENTQLIHYTTDGFYGYNSCDIDNYAIVRSFNGLLISDDLIESNENTNYGNNYSDFNDIYKNQVKNPNKLIKLTKEEIQKLKNDLDKKKSKVKKASNYLYEEYEEDEQDEKEISNVFEKEQYKLYKKNLSSLVKQQEKDKNTILNSGVYNNDIIKEAEDEVLDMSPSLLRALDEHYKYRRIA